MTIEDGIKAILTASPYPLAVQDRVYHVHFQHSSVPTTPYLVFMQITPEPLMTHSGSPSMQQRFYQFSIFGTSQSQCVAIRNAVRSLINAALSTTWGTVQIKGVFHEGSRDAYEQDTKLYNLQIDFKIQFIEA